MRKGKKRERRKQRRKVSTLMSIFQSVLSVVLLFKVSCNLQMILNEYYRDTWCFVKQVQSSYCIWDRFKRPLLYGHIRVYGVLLDPYPLSNKTGCTKVQSCSIYFLQPVIAMRLLFFLIHKILMRSSLDHQHKTPEQW